MAESDRLLSDCTPLKGVPRVQIPLSPPVLFVNFYFYRIKFFNLSLTFFNLSTLEPHIGFEVYRVLKSMDNFLINIEFR